ncbi:MAG: hypothetical protein ACHQT7_01610 [Candidatus Levyibacteriota bacterium]
MSTEAGSSGKIPTNRIERSVLRRGRNLQAKMEGEQMPLIVDENYAKAEEARGLPPMSGTRNRASYNRHGEIFIVQYRSETVPSKRRYAKYRDIERAIRGTGYVKEEYDRKNGEAGRKTRGVMAQVRKAAKDFQRRELTNKEIADIAIGTAESLAENGYANAKDLTKQKITRDLLRAQGLDRLGHRNPSRNRLMISHPYIDLERRLLIMNETGTKYDILHSAFIRERALERTFLEAAAEDMEATARLRPGGIRPISRELPGLKSFVYDYLSPYAIRVAPYAATAAAIRYLILGHMNDTDFSKLEDYLGNEMAKKFVGQKQFRDFTVLGEVQANLRIFAEAIRDVLEYGERNMLKENAEEEPYVPKLPFLRTA